MQTWLSNAWSQGCNSLHKIAAAAGILWMSASAALAMFFLSAPCAFAAETHEAGGEANLKLPDLSKVSFLGVDGHKLLLFGLVICFLGLLFGLVIYSRLKNLPVHKSMKDISELIY